MTLDDNKLASHLLDKIPDTTFAAPVGPIEFHIDEDTAITTCRHVEKFFTEALKIRLFYPIESTHVTNWPHIWTVARDKWLLEIPDFSKRDHRRMTYFAPQPESEVN